ncbi:TPA: phage portal protein, partial [Streptococcus agalactiae]
MAHIEDFIDSTGEHKLLELRFHRESRMRYQISDISALFDDNYKILLEYLKHHENIQKPRIQELLDYAEGNNHEVSKSGRRQDEDMADVRAIHNYGKYISTFKQGYLVGNPIRVEYDDEVNNELLKELAKKNNFHQLNRQLIKDLSKVGRAYELAYRSADDKTKVIRLDPRETFIIYKNDVDKDSLIGVRYYNKSQI